MIGYLLLLSLACALSYDHKFCAGGIKQTILGMGNNVTWITIIGRHAFVWNAVLKGKDCEFQKLC